MGRIAGRTFLEKPKATVNLASFIQFPLLLIRNCCFNVEPFSAVVNYRQKFLFIVKELYFRLCIFGFYLDSSSLALKAILDARVIGEIVVGLREVLSSSLIAITSSIVFYRRKEILNFCATLQLLIDDRIAQEPHHDIQPHLDSYRRFTKFFMFPFVMGILTAVILVISYLSTGNMALTGKFWFPFDEFQRNTFPIALAWNVWISWICCIWIPAPELLTFALVNVISMEFEFLSTELSSLSSIELSRRNEKFKSLINWHEKLTALSDELQKIYGFILLNIFVIISIILCLSIHQLIVEEIDFVSLPFNIAYVGIYIGRACSYCVIGERLINSSLSVTDGVYNSGWEDFKDLRTKNFILMLMLRAQKPSRLRILTFHQISLSTTLVSVSFSVLWVNRFPQLLLLTDIVHNLVVSNDCEEANIDRFGNSSLNSIILSLVSSS